MLSSVLMTLALILLAPWWPDEVPPGLSAEDRLPVVLVVESPETVTPEGFDATHASRRVVEGVAARLRARGVAVQARGAGALLLMQPGGQGPGMVEAGGREIVPTDKVVTLSVAFNAGNTPRASGTETHFGGEGNASWRLAERIQQHLVRGLWDVMGYDSYDRGAVEVGEGDSPAGRPLGLREGSQWVATYPLFATNPRERALLEWPETLDLLSSALANALYDYLNPSLPTPQRSSRLGWRRSEPWQPVPPRLVWQAEQGTRVALTFDGGASSAPTPAILNALREAGVRATMFMTAEFVEKNPELVVQMARDGHEFGNHSSTHPDMTTLSTPAIVAELERLEAAVLALTGKSTRPWFRPPFGAYSDRLVQVVGEQGYSTIMWTADSADWRNDVSAATVERRVLTYATPGAILVQHLGSPQSAEVLPEVLRRLKERGVSFGTLSEVLGVP